MVTTMENKNTALVSATRMEEAPPGHGVPAGWLPEIVYRLLAENVADEPEGHTIQIRFKEDLLIRRLQVVRGGESWDVAIRIDNETRLARAPAITLSELSLARWPLDKPERVRKVQVFHLTLYRTKRDRATNGDASPPFECLIRGVEVRP